MTSLKSFFAVLNTFVWALQVEQYLFQELTTIVFPSFWAYLKSSIVKLVFFSNANTFVEIIMNKKVKRIFFILIAL